MTHRRSATPEQSELLTDRLGRLDRAVHLDRSGNGETVGHLQRLELLFRVRICARHHERGKPVLRVALRDRHERAQDQELFGPLSRQPAQHVQRIDTLPRRRRILRSCRHPGRRQRRTTARSGRVGRDLPETGTGEERRGALDVVLAVHVGLIPEQILRVTEVLLDRFGHLREVGEQLGERRPIGLDDRVLVVHDVVRDRAVVGVDRRLHRVADVVEAPARARVRRHALGVRVVVARRETVEHPNQTTVRDDRVGVTIKGQKRCRGLDSLRDVLAENDPSLVVNLTRDEQVLVAEAQCKCGLAEP